MPNSKDTDYSFTINIEHREGQPGFSTDFSRKGAIGVTHF